MTKEVTSEAEQGGAAKDYRDPPPAPLLDLGELRLWSLYRALIAEFVATLLFLYVTVATVIGHKNQGDPCAGVGLLGIAWAFGGMIFILVYCTAGISGGHINPAVTFGRGRGRVHLPHRRLPSFSPVPECPLPLVVRASVSQATRQWQIAAGGGRRPPSSVTWTTPAASEQLAEKAQTPRAPGDSSCTAGWKVK